MPGEGKPALQQRRGGGHAAKERAAADHSHHRQLPEHRIAGNGRIFPAVGNDDRQRGGADQQHRYMKRCLPRRLEEAGREMGPRVTGQQHGLEENHRRVPDRRRAAEKRQDHLAQQRLNRKQQKRAEQQRQGIKRNKQAGGRHSGGVLSKSLPVGRKMSRQSAVNRASPSQTPVLPILCLAVVNIAETVAGMDASGGRCG